MNGYGYSDPTAPRENAVAGAAGAFLFALAGGALYFLLSRFNLVSALCGLVTVFLAVKGYKRFSKGESKKGVLIAVVMSMIVLTIAWYTTLAYDVYDAYQNWYEAGEIDYTVNFFEAFGNAYRFLEDGELLRAYLTSLILGLVFAALGSIGFIRGALRQVDENKAFREQQILNNSDFSAGANVPRTDHPEETLPDDEPGPAEEAEFVEEPAPAEETDTGSDERQDPPADGEL